MVVDLDARLLEALLNHQLAIARLGARESFPVSLLAGHILSEVLKSSAASSGVLVEKLRAERTGVSRVLSQLERQALVRVRRDPVDRRHKNYEITTSGREILCRQNAASSRVSKILLRRLSSAERARVESYFSVLADALQAPQASPSPGLNRFARTLRRLTRVAGLLGSRNARTLPFDQLQALRVIAGSVSGLKIQAIAEATGAEESACSRLVSRLESSGFVKRSKVDEDARVSGISLSEEGARQLGMALKHLAGLIAQACRGWDSEKKEDLGALIEKYASPGLVVRGALIERASTEEQRKKAREFYVSLLVRERRAHSLEAKIFDERSLTFVVKGADRILGVIECGADKGGAVRLSEWVPRLRASALRTDVEAALTRKIRRG